MGIIDGILSMVGSLGSAGISARATKQTNEFNAEQAQLQREYETQERLDTQEWQEQMYNQYYSPEAMVSQYENAGLNPALMYGDAGASSGSMPSGSPMNGAAASAVPYDSAALDVIGNAVDSFLKIEQGLNLASKTKTEDAMRDINAENIRAATDKLRSDITSSDYQNRLTEAMIDKCKAETNTENERFLNMTYENQKQAILSACGFMVDDQRAALLATTAKTIAETKHIGFEDALTEAQTALGWSENAFKEADNAFYDRTGFRLGCGLGEMAATAAINCANEVSSGIHSVTGTGPQFRGKVRNFFKKIRGK